jgi:uncharacterized lipoprotein YajG
MKKFTLLVMITSLAGCAVTRSYAPIVSTPEMIAAQDATLRECTSVALTEANIDWQLNPRITAFGAAKAIQESANENAQKCMNLRGYRLGEPHFKNETKSD